MKIDEKEDRTIWFENNIVKITTKLNLTSIYNQRFKNN